MNGTLAKRHSATFAAPASLLVLLATTAFAQNNAQAERSNRGVIALYDFASTSGEIVTDRSGSGSDLKIANLSRVRRANGSLEIIGDTIIRAEKPAAKLMNAIKTSREITIEAWVRPGNTNQKGPARIVTLSENSVQRNFTLGQEKNAFDLRLRTNKTSDNGLPSVSSPAGSLKTQPTHVVYTRNRSGEAHFYVNGKRVSSGRVEGDFSNWNANFRLALGNEVGGSRNWRGTYYLVAIYNRSLGTNDVTRNFEAGPGVKIEPAKLAKTPPPMPDKAKSDWSGTRDSRGVSAFFDFASESGPVVKDRSGSGLDLKIADMKAVRRSAGKLTTIGSTTIRTAGATTKLSQLLKRSRAVSIEAWVEPAKANQSGPARIVTLSKNSNERNFTLGQDGNRFDVRLRTTKTTTNGIPSVASLPGSLKTKLTHVVYTRDRTGKVHIYLDGKHNAQSTVDGATSNWDDAAVLGLGNEMTGDRQWLGTYHMVAIYNRSLGPKDVAKNFKAGPGAESAVRTIAKVDPKAQHFERKIAPLLSKHCLECHDASTHQGGLVLSHKEPAFKGGESGIALVAGKSADSPLWESVESDDMPHERTPLTNDEKTLLRKWIDDGATWSLDVIDPAVYAHSGGGTQQYVRRLTVPEYIETVRVAVGVDITKEATEMLPADLRADGFSNTAYNLNVDLSHVQAYARLAEVIVSRMDVPKFVNEFGKRRNFTDPVMRPLIGRIGKWLLRGPLDNLELASLRGITTTVAASGGTVDESLGYVIEAMLQSPRFIYRIEDQPTDGGSNYVSSYELASRMSYTLWGGPPDKQLMKAAEQGNLGPEGVREQTKRMLSDPRAIAHSKRFISEWLNLGRLKNLRPNAKKFPTWNAKLAADMRSETVAFFEDVVWKQKKPLAELLNAPVTYATPELAKHYGMKAKGDGLARYDVSENPQRGGLLTQGSVLTVGGDEASMVTRGLFVMHELLRGVVKDPPPCVDTTPVPTEPGLTKRSIAMGRITNASCGGCHSKFEPLAFGLEKYDGLGAFHDRDEHGNDLRSDGNLLFPGQATAIQYKTSKQLMDLLAQSERVKESITWKVTQFAVGRPLGAGDAKVVGNIHAEAMKNGGTYQALMTAIMNSDLIQMTGVGQ